MKKHDFPKSVRLLKSADFDRVFEQRCSRADRWIVAYFAVSEIERPRLGLVVSKKCGNAVQRNRWKRALREAFRLVQHELPRHLDIVVLPRRGAEPNVVALQSSLRQLGTWSLAHLPRSGDATK